MIMTQDFTGKSWEITEDVGKSIALRLLIHYVGDSHQPLHMAARVNKDNLTGDKGGNGFKLTPKADIGKGVTNLHKLWDSVIYKF